jgi:DNA (cytosine-5)-methyltransferase 1
MEVKHLGDICKINGAEIEIVDVITGGSPCQDLSIAGKRAGLAGARSGLFMAQIRIVKEMREHDRANGRTGDMVRPRFMVWENVPGAFSSNKGKDFAAVLEEIIRIAEPEAPDIDVPEKGWPTWGGYHDEVGGRWSVAWRVHDAQYWGVPQRRRRISVVADFGGDTAGEILFERKSVSRHPTESGTAREGFAEAAERGFNPAVGDCMTAWDCQSKRIFDTNGKSPTLQGGVGGGVNNPAIFAAIPINDKATRWQGGGESRNHDGSGNGLGIGKEGDPSPTLTAGDRHGVMCMTPWDAQSQRVYDGNGVSPTLSSRENSGLNREAVLCAGFKAGQGAQAGGIGYSEEVSPTLAAAPSGTNQTPAVVALDMSHACDVIRDCGEIVPSLQARMGTGGNQVPLTYQMQGFGDYRAGEVASSCKQRDFKDSTDLVCAVDCRNFREGGETNGTLQAKSNGGISYNLQNTVRTGMIVRRLTPMECERLQGFPDGWTDIGEWRDSKGKLRKPSDSPRYKALGNSIALPFWDFLAKRISAQYLRPVTMGSLFDGIGGFPLVFERHNGKGTARWASEIEEFPIAVTKLRFGED